MTRYCLTFATLCLAGLMAAAPAATPAAAPAGAGVTAARAGDFLNSLGANSAIAGRGENLQKTIECTKYLGLRFYRTEHGNAKDLIAVYEQAGAKTACLPGSGVGDFNRCLGVARELAKAGALLAIEGTNEPNNWGLTYQGKKGGGKDSWVPIADQQRDLYKAVKADPVLKDYPVWNLSESGAQTDNCGLQFLTIPAGANTLLPAGTKFADFACCHNYFCHPSIKGRVIDNLTWHSADPTMDEFPTPGHVDGLYGNYGSTWGKHFPGYSKKDLETLPRVTTETGATVEGAFTEEIQGVLYTSVYLAQFKRSWSHTAIYIMRDRTDEAGNQSFGFYKGNYQPRKAALYLHNLTTVLADKGEIKTPGKLGYSIASQPATVHDLLLQKSDGKFFLVVWGEKFTGGSDKVTVNLGAAFPTVKVYDQAVGTDATETLSNVNSVPLTLTNHAMIIEIAPKQ